MPTRPVVVLFIWRFILSACAASRHLQRTSQQRRRCLSSFAPRYICCGVSNQSARCCSSNKFSIQLAPKPPTLLLLLSICLHVTTTFVSFVWPSPALIVIRYARCSIVAAPVLFAEWWTEVPPPLHLLSISLPRHCPSIFGASRMVRNKWTMRSLSFSRR